VSRLDTILVEFYRLQQIQALFDGQLASDVARAQVYRWMAEIIIGYRNSRLALDALRARPSLPGLEFKIWNPFRDETLASIPIERRVALQCFSLAHEIGHLTDGQIRSVGIRTEIDGLPVLSHITYDFRATGSPPEEVEKLGEFCEREVDADQLISEISADLFAFDAVCTFLTRVVGCSPELAVDLSLMSCEALIFVYHLKERCRLLTQVATSRIGADDYPLYQFLNGLAWSARSRAIGRRAGIILTYLEEGSPDDFNRNVGRIDALIRRTQKQRNCVQDAIEACDETLLELVLGHLSQDAPSQSLSDRLSEDPDLRIELFYLLIAFGCSGGVDVEGYLNSMDEMVHKVVD
jgi:hypothetical protein